MAKVLQLFDKAESSYSPVNSLPHPQTVELSLETRILLSFVCYYYFPMRIVNKWETLAEFRGRENKKKERFP